MTEPATSTTDPTTDCHVCGKPVPQGEFCGACGAYLVPDSPGAAQRSHAYAANPSEHILHLNVVSTLFPHLPHRRSAPFRIFLLVAAVVLVILGYERLTGPAIAAAALAVPLLYLLYLYEVEVYEDEPVYIIGLTVVAGGILGAIWAYATGSSISQTSLLQTSQGVDNGQIFVNGVVYPLLALALILVGALIIYFTRRYDEALDGFTFGAAGAMGFAFAATVVNLWPQLTEGLQSGAPAVDNTFEILRFGLFVPFIYASVAGLIAGAVWLRRGPTRPLPARAWTTTVWVNILIGVAASVVIGLTNVYTIDASKVVIMYAVVAVVLLFWVRIALHHMLLAEAVEVEIGPDAPCFHCQHIVARMAFCPHCGIATRATPKHGIGRFGRAVR
jgi:hypothetical protein